MIQQSKHYFFFENYNDIQFSEIHSNTHNFDSSKRFLTTLWQVKYSRKSQLLNGKVMLSTYDSMFLFSKNILCTWYAKYDQKKKFLCEKFRIDSIHHIFIPVSRSCLQLTKFALLNFRVCARLNTRGGTNIKKPNFEHSEPQRIELRTQSNISFGPKTELRTSRTSPKTELFANFINKKWAQYFSKSSKPNFEHVRTCDFGQKPNFEPPERHQKPNSSQTSNCLFHL